MPAIWYLAATWIAGTVLKNVTREANKLPPPDDSTPKDTTALKLDALKAIRESAFVRWDKRRSYEWQLSVSIWTAVAAFCALVLNRDNPLKSSTATLWSVALAGLLIVLFHGIYLWLMFDNTIGDAHIQRWAEKEMYKLVFEKELPTHEAGFSKHAMYPKLWKYGIVQVFITFVLVIGAVAAVRADRLPASTPDHPQNADAKKN